MGKSTISMAMFNSFLYVYHLDNPCFRSPWNLCRLQALGNEDSLRFTTQALSFAERLWDDFSNLNWMGRFS